ncbi:zinc finger protein basonuclin-1 [Eucyclogobius newberryi]|uniref:zinc finger protein basonuclin-1 n=1 Tax=Eucyclogobius newberryi TaxID=166745 RepID=UPI003B5BA54F
MTMAEAICCTLVNCNCDSFKPGKLKRRQCDNCKHGWVAHALSKLKVHHMYQSSQVEIVHSNVVFDICSLMLYGTQAIPIRLKILLDRLFSVLKQEEVIQILNALDWTLQDYIRGYVLQDIAGKVLDRWAIMTFEEEIATLQQFLRFGETKSIVELMALQDKEGQAVLVPSTRTNSDIRTFIERNTPRTTANLTTTNVEKLSGNSMHHFENFINSMAFMLPFQLLGSVPTPFLGSQNSMLQQHQQRGTAENQRRDEANRDSLARENSLTFSHANDSTLLGSGSATFGSDLDSDKHLDGLQGSATTKIEPEDFSASDNYSDGPSTPCTPSMSSEVAQMSPEGKIRSLDRNGPSSGGGIMTSNGGVGAGGLSLLKKGRVFCNACEKTFYDKGTLKIHYNAVHLKIKHKCTIDGCNMVFSSLRSRNRHSANPNPRLHMPMNRNNRDKDMRGSLSADESSQERRNDYGSPISDNHKSMPSYMVSQLDNGSKLNTSFSSMGQSGILFPNLKTVQPVLPFYRSLVTPAELANTPGTLPSLPLLSSSVPVKPTAMQEPCILDPIPKKKSRKSSMPIKIEKETMELNDGLMDKGSSSEDEMLHDKDFDNHIFARKMEFEDMDKQNLGDNLNGRQMELGVITCATSPFEKSEKNFMNGDDERDEITAHKISEHKWNNGDLTNGNSPQNVDAEKDEELEDFADSTLDENSETPHHCEICSKTFKNPYSVKMHYQSVHLKEMHLCNVDGCNAAFPSRRSRDRHSSNLNLHHKLLTKDTYSPSSGRFSPVSLCRDRDSALDSHPDPLDPQDPLSRDPSSQTSVIFRGHNRMGLVYPMSKLSSIANGIGNSPSRDNLDEGTTGGEDGAVLDLSTSSFGPVRGGGSARSSWDSDGAGSDEGMEDLDAVPIGDSDESCDGINGKSQELVSPDMAVNCAGQGATGGGAQANGVGSPITCHVCQKVYSNKGTFRAHYKTVHLRLLHKCKVPGCDTSFSSVRSRNRHSQNPNLHRNLAVSSGPQMDQE